MFTENLAGTLALIGIVILVASLLSGVIERSGLPQVGIFLVLGALLGPAGLGLINLTLESPTLQIIATLALVLVLFSDAIAMDMGEVSRQRRLALLALAARTLVLLPVLAQAGVAPRDRRLIAWFGPRGLSSLLLILLAVFAGMPGSVRLFEITCLVVLLSVLLHGAAIAAFLRKDTGPAPAIATAPEPATRAAAAKPAAAVPERITLAEVRRLQEAASRWCWPT